MPFYFVATGEWRNLNVYKFAATCDYGDSIRWDVADLWVSNAAWPPLRASCNLVHYVRSLIHRFSVSRWKRPRLNFVRVWRKERRRNHVKSDSRRVLTRDFWNGWGEKVNFYGPVYVKKLWSGTASWIFQWMIKRREAVWWKIWRISSLSFLVFRRNFELIFRFMSSQLRKFERRFFYNEHVQSFICNWNKICMRD